MLLAETKCYLSLLIQIVEHAKCFNLPTFKVLQIVFELSRRVTLPYARSVLFGQLLIFTQAMRVRFRGPPPDPACPAVDAFLCLRREARPFVGFRLSFCCSNVLRPFRNTSICFVSSSRLLLFSSDSPAMASTISSSKSATLDGERILGSSAMSRSSVFSATTA